MIDVICSPVKGNVITLEKVPDVMFAQKLLGNGLAVRPESKSWYAPVNGIITVIYETKHAIGITSDHGTEVLLHIGLDTFDLKGKPYEIKVCVDDHVHIGDLLMMVDYEYINQMGYDTITPIISTNKDIQILKFEGEVNVGDVLFQVND